MAFWDEEVEPILKKERKKRKKEKQDYYERHHPDLNSMSTEELETLYAQTEVEITHLEKRIQGMREFGRIVRDQPQRKDSSLGDIVKFLGEALPDVHPANEEIRDKKKLLAAIKVKLKQPAALPAAAPAAAPPIDRDQQILDEIRKVKAWEAAQLANETDPEMRNEIQRAARKKLDRLREKL